MAKVFIVGFPKDMQDIELVEIFSIHGAVNTVTIVTDQLTSANKGYGFFTMTDDAGARRAIKAFDGVIIDGRTINVQFAGENIATNATPTETAKAGIIDLFKVKFDLRQVRHQQAFRHKRTKPDDLIQPGVIIHLHVKTAHRIQLHG